MTLPIGLEPGPERERLMWEAYVRGATTRQVALVWGLCEPRARELIHRNDARRSHKGEPSLAAGTVTRPETRGWHMRRRLRDINTGAR